MDSFALISLQGVIEPPPVGWWPLAWGWQWVLLTLALLILTGLAVWMRRWPWQVWLAQWRLVRGMRKAANASEALDILQRVVKHFVGREEAVYASGPTLHAWLASQAGRLALSEGWQTDWRAQAGIFSARYQSDGLNGQGDLQTLRRLTRVWMQAYWRAHVLTH